MKHFPPETQRYFAALGSFVAFWALTEFLLDKVIVHMIQKWDGDPPETLLPKGLKRKLEVFKEYLNTHDLGFRKEKELQNTFRQTFLEFAGLLHEIGEARHWAAHGVGLATIVAKHDKETIEFIRSQRRKIGEVEKRKYTLTQLEYRSRQCWALASSLVGFDYMVLQGVSKDVFCQTFPSFPRKRAGIFKVSKRLRDKKR